MPQGATGTPVFHYVIEVQHREFLLSIDSSGTSHWEDHTGRRALRAPSHINLELEAFTGNKKAVQRLEAERVEFTISLDTPRKVLAMAVKMGRSRKPKSSSSSEITKLVRATSNDIAEMDSILSDFFWKEVNPLLSKPLLRDC